MLRDLCKAVFIILLKTEITNFLEYIHLKASEGLTTDAWVPQKCLNTGALPNMDPLYNPSGNLWENCATHLQDMYLSGNIIPEQ